MIGIPLLGNRKASRINQIFHFMFVDRYEIHIQVFGSVLRDLHHFPEPVFDFSSFRVSASQNFKNKAFLKFEFTNETNLVHRPANKF